MTVSFPWQQQFSWRKLGYLYFEDSLSYRDVLLQNPQWTVTELPPLGAQLRVSGTTSKRGGLVQGNFIYGLPSGEYADAIYPYRTEAEYIEALNRYTLQGVVKRESLNGITFDSEQALTGIQ